MGALYEEFCAFSRLENSPAVQKSRSFNTGDCANIIALCERFPNCLVVHRCSGNNA